MAKVLEQTFLIKLSRIVKDSDDSVEVLDNDNVEVLLSNVPSIVESLIEAPGVIVEVLQLD